ncbi:hypothetical protein F511_03097 [Dorcoceras hygrometricum]|nr:hypothetical protein F511_03097 [Dorcoceras hygrometricum]
MEELGGRIPETHDCLIKLRVSPQRRKEKVTIGCGAGFGGDRPIAALRLLQRVKELDYLVLECLAERTLADRYCAMQLGGKGYDPRISEWMQLLLPLAVERGVCIITNMGAMSPHGAQQEVLNIASKMGININVGLAYQSSVSKIGLDDHLRHVDRDVSVYLGAAPLVECLEMYSPDVIITSRVADASLFLAPMVFELGWNWNELQLLAQGSLAGHLLECGCQLTGGYYMHPGDLLLWNHVGDKYRNMSFQNLLDLSLPFAEVTFDGTVSVAKAEGTGGVINFCTCAEQLLYEIGDPSAYITPDVIIDFRNVTFQPLSNSKVLCSGAKPSFEPVPQKMLCLGSKDGGWKGWGEISYGGRESIQRAKAAEFLVRAWIDEIYPGISSCIFSYIIGLDSLKASSIDDTLPKNIEDIRFRMDGVFEKEEHAVQFTKEFMALYTNGPAGGGGISTGCRKEIFLEKGLVDRKYVHWQIGVVRNNASNSTDQQTSISSSASKKHIYNEPNLKCIEKGTTYNSSEESSYGAPQLSAAPSGIKIPLYSVAHCRVGDKGNDLNLSIIPHFLPDIERLKVIVTPAWVRKVVSALLNPSTFLEQDATDRRDKWADENVKVEIYDVKGICSLNVVVRNILDGGVNCSRRIDRHGKTISDIILSQKVVLPP